MTSRCSTRWCFRLSFTAFSDSGLPVRCVGQASLQRPHSVQVKASSPSFQVRSRAVRTPAFMSASSVAAIRRSMSTDGTRFAGPPRRKYSAGKAVTMWKCSPVGSSTRKANTTAIWTQYDTV